jgi:hypothetical protein
MRLQILDLARDDLVEGFRFYESKDSGLGRYFLVNLYSDIESLKVFGGTHRKAYRGFHRVLSKRDAPLQSTTPLKRIPFGFGL